MFHTSSGHGKAILWVHGLPLNHHAWHFQQQALDPYFYNILCDLRGYGQSEPLPNHTSSISQIYADDLHHLIQSLNLDHKINIVGFASGGYTTLKLATQHADIIDKIAVINASPCFSKQDHWPYGFTTDSLEAFIDQLTQAKSYHEIADILLKPAFCEPSIHHDSDLYQWFTRMTKEARLETILGFFQNIAKEDIRHLLPSIPNETLILSGKLGHEVPYPVGRYLAEQIPNAHLVEINDVGHFAFATQHHLISKHLHHFFNPQITMDTP